MGQRSQLLRASEHIETREGGNRMAVRGKILQRLCKPENKDSALLLPPASRVIAIGDEYEKGRGGGRSSTLGFVFLPLGGSY